MDNVTLQAIRPAGNLHNTACASQADKIFIIDGWLVRTRHTGSEPLRGCLLRALSSIAQN